MGKLTLTVSLVALFATFAIPMVASFDPPAQPEHIFLLAGQSNMMGHAGIKKGTDGLDYWDQYVPPQCQSNPKIFRLDRNLSWDEAREPTHDGIFPNQKVTGIGPSMPFANHILELAPGYGTIGLVPCAFDWTSMDDWARNSTKRAQDSKLNLYENLIVRAKASVKMGGKIAALLWWQGGKDARHLKEANQYKSKLEQFFKDVTADLGKPDMLILMIVIPPGREQYTDIVREAQLSIKLPNLMKFDIPGLPLEADNTHVNSTGQVTVGRTVAYHYCSAGHC